MGLDHRVHRTPTKQHEDLAKRLLNNEHIQPAMIAANYSPKRAKQGVRAIPKTVLKLMPKLAKSNLMMLGEMRAEDQETLVRGRLAYNTIVGQDKGVLSAKALGSDRRVNMFQPDIQTGIVVLSMPTPALDDKAKIIDAQEE
jgi:hypothetical protein